MVLPSLLSNGRKEPRTAMRVNLELDEAKAVVNSLTSTVEEKVRDHLVNGGNRDELITLINLKDRINGQIRRVGSNRE
jgi:hypothetical protein